MAKRSYFKVPKKVNDMTEEELEAFASAVYENMMAKFAQDHSGLSEESSEA